jgi:hypothetical protein
MFVAPELRDKFDGQVKAAQALYVDYLFNLRPDQHKTSMAIRFTPEERARWFEHNVYYALKSSDEYVWLYSEMMDWWKNKDLPPGLEQAVVSARGKVARDETLGFDFDDTMRAAKAKYEAALQMKLMRRAVRIPKITAAQKPKIDGRLDEPIYAAASALDPFVGYVNLDGDPAPLKGATRAWLTYDDENLYIAFRNSEPAMNTLKVAGTTRDSAVYGGDSVEISLQPDLANNTIYHMILNPENVQWDAIDRDKMSDVSYNPNWQSAVVRGADEWTVEAAIPWRALNMAAPKTATAIRANLARQRLAGETPELSSWSQFVSGFQEPANFGRWIFR